MNPFEIWEDPNTGVRFYFSHSNQEFTTGIMMIPAGKALPKHNRPLAVENLVQVSGECEITTFDEQDRPSAHVMGGRLLT